MDLDEGGVGADREKGRAPGRIMPVQMLRFLAACAVLAHHAELLGYHLGRYRGVELARPEAMNAGAFGVDLFFAISGFIMVVSSGKLFGADGARRAFLQRRLIRIVPMYWLVTALVVAWDWRFGAPGQPEAVLPSLIFYPWSSGPTHTGVQVPVAVAWTLYYEMLFYAVFAACLARDAASTAWRCAVALGLLAMMGHLLQPPMPFAYWTRPIIVEFIGGMGLALLWQGGLRLPVVVRLGMLLAAATLVFAAFPITEAKMIGWSRVLTWGLAGWLVLGATVLGPLRWARSAAWGLGGDISYALYLIHLPLIGIVQFLWRHFKLPYGPWGEVVFVTLTILASLLAALIIHLKIERPLTQRLNRIVPPVYKAAPA